MEIVPCSPAHREAVEQFNAKLAAAGSVWSFPVDGNTTEDPSLTGHERFVAVENGDVYGGYLLKRQQCFLDGESIEIGSLQLPLSLGDVDSEFGRVSVALLFDAIRRTPYVYSLGLGSEETKFARLLAAAGWPHLSVPFYFSPKSPNRFARNIRLPAGHTGTQALLRAAGYLRVTRPAFALQQLRVRRRASNRPGPAVDVREIASFDERADGLFLACVDRYSFVCDRGFAALSREYPAGEPRFVRVVVERGGELVGWVVLLDTQMADDKYFGDLRVGSIVDCFAAPEDALTVLRAADEMLTQRGVDLVVSNQLHADWYRALEALGYRRGPSNFFFYYSDRLAERLQPTEGWPERCHLNRGDGEGPGHL